jgi:hypothetical protein
VSTITPGVDFDRFDFMLMGHGVGAPMMMDTMVQMFASQVEESWWPAVPIEYVSNIEIIMVAGPAILTRDSAKILNAFLAAGAISLPTLTFTVTNIVVEINSPHGQVSTFDAGWDRDYVGDVYYIRLPRALADTMTIRHENIRDYSSIVYGQTLWKAVSILPNLGPANWRSPLSLRDLGASDVALNP